MEVKQSIESVAIEFRSGNSIPVERTTITRERMQEILNAHCLNETQSLRNLLKDALEPLSSAALAWNEYEPRDFGEKKSEEALDLFYRIKEELGESCK